MAFRDNYSLRQYGRMVNEKARMDAFAGALQQAVAGGKVVLDIGTGAGIFAFLACQFGASKVYAIEPDDAIEIAKLCAASNPGMEKIEWIQGLSTEISLPEKVDVVIADLHGTLPFYNDNIDSIIDARTRHLKSGGTIIPCRDTLFAVPAQAPLEAREVQSPWAINSFSLNLDAGLPFVTNSWWRASPEAVPSGHLLATGKVWGVVDYRECQSADIEGVQEWTIERAGALDGFYVWFDGHTSDSHCFSNSPANAELVYGRAFFPLERPVDVAVDDVVALKISAKRVDGKYIFCWDTAVCGPSGVKKAKFSQNTFRSRIWSATDLRRRRADYIPAISLRGRADLFILQGLASAASLGEIAEAAFREFPDRFATVRKALDHVLDMSHTYSK